MSDGFDDTRENLNHRVRFSSIKKAPRPMSDGFGDPWENLNCRVRFSSINKSHPMNIGWLW